MVTTWRISINQIEAAGFHPGIQHLLALFADGLPNNVDLYGHMVGTEIMPLRDHMASRLLYNHHFTTFPLSCLLFLGH